MALPQGGLDFRPGNDDLFGGALLAAAGVLASTCLYMASFSRAEMPEPEPPFFSLTGENSNPSPAFFTDALRIK